MKISIDHIDIQDILEFMETGDVKNAPEDIVRYLQLLDATHKMQLRINQWGTKEAVLKHLILVENLSRYKAAQIYDETLEYFYSDQKISKTAWRNIYAERADNRITAATLLATTIEDFDRISRMELRAYKMRQLDLPEPPVFPKELLEKPVKLYAMDIEFLGEEKINRLELAQQIDGLPDHTPFQKEILKQDAAITQIKFLPDEQEDLRKKG